MWGLRLAALCASLIAADALAAPTFVQSQADYTEPLSLTLNLTAGNVLVVSIWGDTASFPVSVNDPLGTTFTSIGGTLAGQGALSTRSTALFFAQVQTSGSRTLTFNRAAASTSSGFLAFEFSGATTQLGEYAVFRSAGPPAMIPPSGGIEAGPGGLLFGQVLVSGSIVDAGTDLLPLTFYGNDYYGWGVSPTSGTYSLTVPVTGAWMGSFVTLGPPAVFTDGGTDAGMSDAGIPDAGALDSGVADSGTPDAGRADAGAPDASVPDAGAADGGSMRGDAGALDAGPNGARELEAGCGCGASPAMPLIGLLLLLARRRTVLIR